MNLEQLTAGMPELVKITGNAQTEIKALTADSRAKCEDGLFFCIRGGRVDAHDFAPQAVAGGCVALVVERELAIDCPQVVVTDVRAAMTRIASAFNGHPERRMKLVGVTGTKGKTTTTYLFKSIVESAGMRCGIIGTTGCIAGQTKLPSHLTTPDPIEMFEILRIMADAGVEVVCMEVSAHALYLRKLVGVVFEAAAYTNLSQDHLDFFGTMDNYLAAKKLLFSAGMARNAAVNVDEVLRYFTVQVFVMNWDSYLGHTGHNYFLYEEDGVISILPWDYNLAFGTYALGMTDPIRDPDVLINWPINTPARGETMLKRPLYHNLMKNNDYFARYHAYFDQLLTEYFESGRYEAVIRQTQAMIAPYVEVDPTAFCSYEDHLLAVDTLLEVCRLRSESIRGQLEGDYPITLAQQGSQPGAGVDASHVDLRALGDFDDLETARERQDEAAAVAE